jgi:uncharacterized NAD-dependent epimerase/dehydratase family protein
MKTIARIFGRAVIQGFKGYMSPQLKTAIHTALAAGMEIAKQTHNKTDDKVVAFVLSLWV